MYLYIYMVFFVYLGLFWFILVYSGLSWFILVYFGFHGKYISITFPLKKYFTSCDPHHDIYTFSYWQIFWHSI